MADSQNATHVKCGEVWQNYTSGRLVTIRAVDRVLDRVTFRYSTGRVRTLLIGHFLNTYRPERDIVMNVNGAKL